MQELKVGGGKVLLFRLLHSSRSPYRYCILPPAGSCSAPLEGSVEDMNPRPLLTGSGHKQLCFPPPPSLSLHAFASAVPPVYEALCTPFPYRP